MLCVTLGRTLVAIAFTLHCSCIRHWHRRDGRDAVSAQDAAWNAPASIMRLVSRRDGRSRRRPHYQHIASIVRLVLRMGSSASSNDHWHFPVAPGGFHLRLACLILRDRYEQLRRDRQWSGRMARGDGGKGLDIASLQLTPLLPDRITRSCPAEAPRPLVPPGRPPLVAEFASVRSVVNDRCCPIRDDHICQVWSSPITNPCPARHPLPDVEGTQHAARLPRWGSDRAHLWGAGGYRNGRECEAFEARSYLSSPSVS